MSHRKPILRQNETEQGLTIPFGRRSLILIEIIGYKSFVIPRGDLTNGGRGVCVEALPLLASFEPPPQDRLSRNSELSRRRRRRASRRREEGLGGFFGGARLYISKKANGGGSVGCRRDGPADANGSLSPTTIDPYCLTSLFLRPWLVVPVLEVFVDLRPDEVGPLLLDDLTKECVVIAPCAVSVKIRRRRRESYWGSREEKSCWKGEKVPA